jgi:hypothetical protein
MNYLASDGFDEAPSLARFASAHLCAGQLEASEIREYRLYGHRRSGRTVDQETRFNVDQTFIGHGNHLQTV